MEAGASLDAELEADLVEFASSLGQRVRGTYVPTEESRGVICCVDQYNHGVQKM